MVGGMLVMTMYEEAHRLAEQAKTRAEKVEVDDD